MKRFKLLFLAAAIIGIGSAFTSGGGEEYVRLGPDDYMLKADAINEGVGDCIEDPGHCTYTLITNPGNPPYTDADFTFNPNEGFVWEEL